MKHFLDLIYPICFLLSALIFVGKAKIFTKASEKWWKVLIPIYSSYIFAKITKAVNLFIISIVVYIIYIIGLVAITVNSIIRVSGNYKQFNNFIILIIIWATLFLIILMVLNYLQAYKLAKAFGKGHLYAIAYFLLPCITILILAFGNYEYQYNNIEFEENNFNENINE